MVNVNGVTTTHNLPTISRLEIFSFGGGDDIEVAAAVPTFISAGFGADEIRGGSLQNEIQGGPGPDVIYGCLLYTSPSPRDRTRSRMPSSA